MLIYHYTHRENWKGISQEGLHSGSYALLEPISQDWLKGPFPDYWEILKHRIGDILLKIDVHPLDESIFVQDYGHWAGYERNYILRNLSHPPERYNHTDGEIAYKQIEQSIINLNEYLAKRDEYNYVLPEVYISSAIPSEYVFLSAQQPLIEERLWPTKLGKKLCLWRLQKDVPELAPWIERYKEDHFSHGASQEGRPFYFRR